MIYLGDKETDAPAMKLVNLQDGHAIFVYQRVHKKVSEKLLDNDRVNFIAPADYSEDSRLYTILQKIIDKRVAEIELEKV